jgi:hypothetical protein
MALLSKLAVLNRHRAPLDSRDQRKLVFSVVWCGEAHFAKKGQPEMTHLLKLTLLPSAALLLLAMFAGAQITNEMTFDTTFPFYVGNARMPPGTYRVTQVHGVDFLLLIEDTNGSHSAFIEFTPTHADSPHPQTDVTFNRYGKVDFLSQLWIQGQRYGMQMLPGKAEELAGKSATASRHSVPGRSGG